MNGLRQEIAQEAAKQSEDLATNKWAHTFDIETTSTIIDDERIGVTYLWTYSYYNEEEEIETIYGRTIEEFKVFAEDVLMNLDYQQVIYVHNLSYEFQYIRRFFDWREVFCTDKRKILYCTTKNLIFRCSYCLSNMSLDKYLKNMDVPTLKLPYDYDVKRYPWTTLTQEELDYCAHDTIGLLEAVTKQMEMEGDNVITIPLTSTGYVRRDVKRSLTMGQKTANKKMNNMNVNLYTAMKSAFVGGNTHANRWYSGIILEDVTCYDITSSYPFVQLTRKFPVTPFVHGRNKNVKITHLDKRYAFLLLIGITDIDLKDAMDGMCQISTSKCLYLKNADKDNGRVISAEYLELWCTDVEYGIIKEHYKWKDLEVLDYWYSRYGDLPDGIKSTIYDYFEKKCTLKGDPDQEYLYRKSKSKLNAIYGMSAFDIGKLRYEYKNDDYVKEKSVARALAQAQECLTCAEPYQWGLWTTAWARHNLDEAIRLAGHNFVYCDTDSVYVLDDREGNQSKIDRGMTEINARVRKLSEPYVVRYEGKEYVLGLWLKDKECKRFKTLGAKKYCYETREGKVCTTTAGVSKESGVARLEDFNTGHVFKDATRKIWYQDEKVVCEIEGHTLSIPTSAYFESSDYTLGVTDEYRALIQYVKGRKVEIDAEIFR